MVNPFMLQIFLTGVKVLLTCEYVYYVSNSSYYNAFVLEYDDSVDDDDTSSVHNGKASGRFVNISYRVLITLNLICYVSQFAEIIVKGSNINQIYIFFNGMSLQFPR